MNASYKKWKYKYKLENEKMRCPATGNALNKCTLALLSAYLADFKHFYGIFTVIKSETQPPTAWPQ